MWIELIFIVDRDRVEPWSDALLEAGALSVQSEDADEGSPAEQALFGEPGEPAPASAWQRTRLTALLDADRNVDALLAEAAGLCGDTVPEAHTLREVPEQDWVRATQAQFEPIPIGERLLITPSWHLPPDGEGAPEVPSGPAEGAAGTPSVPTEGAAGMPSLPTSGPGQKARSTIILDPGLAFGTGSHPTTRMCLEWLDARLERGASVIDYGCGSGILAIAAAALGANPVVAIDIDPQAIESTRANARINGVSIETRDPSGTPPAPADVVVANILANPLRILAPLLSSLLRPGGQLVLAGLLDRQADEIAACYPGVDLKPWRSIEGWTCLAGRARSDS